MRSLLTRAALRRYRVLRLQGASHYTAASGPRWTHPTGRTCEAALWPAGQVTRGTGQQGLEALGSLGDPFGVPVSRAEHLHRLPHRTVDLRHGCGSDSDKQMGFRTRGGTSGTTKQKPSGTMFNGRSLSRVMFNKAHLCYSKRSLQNKFVTVFVFPQS